MVSNWDRQASIKLVGGILRLREFTAAQLAKFAGVQLETARAFLKPGKGPGLVEPIGIAGEDALSEAETDADLRSVAPAGETGRKGRPAKLYRLAPDKKAIALNTLADYRRSLEFAEPSAVAETGGAEEDFTPIALVEAALGPLEADGIERNEWQDRIRQARIYLEGARADVRAMVHPGVAATVLQQSAERLGIAQGRLAAIERIGPPKERDQKREAEKPPAEELPWIGLTEWWRVASAAASSHLPARAVPSSYLDLLDPVVHRFGKWAGAADVGMFDPVVVLLDAVRGPDRMSSWVIDACSVQGVRVAAIDLARTTAEDRSRLYGAIDRLRATTPLALANVVMTMDSSAGAASDYVAEIKDLGVLGAWEARSKSKWNELVEDFATVDVEACRAFFVAQGAEYARIAMTGRPGSAVDARKRLFASRVASALSGVTAARAAEAASTFGVYVVPMPGDEPENQPTELRAAASKLMGHVFCFDFADNATIGSELSDAGVKYVPKAIEHMTSGLAWKYDLDIDGY